MKTSLFLTIISISLAAGAIAKGTVELSPATEMAVPAGQPLFKTTTGETIKVTTKTGYSYGWESEVLVPSGNRLSRISFKIALPGAKSLAEIEHVLISVPPGGSSPIVAPNECAKAGFGTVALQNVGGRADRDALASQAIAVANYLLERNPRLKFVFAGFSMGGFAAQAAAWHLVDKCDGLLLIGNYYLNPPLPLRRPVMMLVGENDGVHLGLAQKWLWEHEDLGSNIQLREMPGGHGWGKAKDQDSAFRALLEMRGK